jgi:hypothetical protein
VQWYLGHGAWFSALEVVRRIESGLKGLSAMGAADQRLLKQLPGCDRYICANGDYVVNYGDRYRNGERIATAFVESTVNELIRRRFVKKPPMRWTKAGAHRLLQLRAQVLDGELGDRCARWYPGVRMEDRRGQHAAQPTLWNGFAGRCYLPFCRRWLGSSFKSVSGGPPAGPAGLGETCAERQPEQGVIRAKPAHRCRRVGSS